MTRAEAASASRSAVTPSVLLSDQGSAELQEATKTCPQTRARRFGNDNGENEGGRGGSRFGDAIGRGVNVGIACQRG
jgi:hypothetical protein